MSNLRIITPKRHSIAETNKLGDDENISEDDGGGGGGVSEAEFSFVRNSSHHFVVNSNPISLKSTTTNSTDQELNFRLFCRTVPFLWFNLDIAITSKQEYAVITDSDPEKKGKGVESFDSVTDQFSTRAVSSEQFKEGDQIGAKRTTLGFIEYTHMGVVVEPKIIEGQELTMVVHWQRPNSQSDQSCNDYNCECGYTGPPKAGGYVKSCVKCFKRGDFVFKIQHIGKHLLSPTHPNANLNLGKVLYRGYCNGNFYRGYFLDGKCEGYIRVKRNDHEKIPVDGRVRFVETSQRSKEEILKAASDETTNSKPYNFLWNNCEHAAMLIMTGMRRSFQLENCFKRIVNKVWGYLSYHFRAEAVSDIVEIGEPSEPIPEDIKEEEIEIGLSEHILEEKEYTVLADFGSKEEKE